jgi:DNA topoisomerase-1
MAKAAHLRYVTDRLPGIRRTAGPDGFDYRAPDGSRVTDKATRERIRKLAIPPAYRDVWISPDPNGHLQAVGRDARGRKQYRYHPRWRAIRDQAKYGKMLAFGKVLPEIRERVAADLRKPGLPKEKILAAVVRLLEGTLARIGNDEYTKSNHSFGLTTLRNRHVRVKGSRMVFDFRGKGGIRHHIDLDDRRLARIVRRCQDIPGQELFQYLDEDGEPTSIGSEDVNEYLRETSGRNITAKDFRTWAATNLAALALRELEAVDSDAKKKKNVVQAVEAVAKMLGNTPAICRKCYIHPAIFEGYLDGTLLKGLQDRAEGTLDRPAAALTAEEAAVTAFLARRLARSGRSRRKGSAGSVQTGSGLAEPRPNG